MSKIHRADQGTKEWWEARRGIPTASNFHRIITPGGKPSSQARAYMYRLIAERLLGDPMEDRPARGEWPEHGVNWEAAAIVEFQKRHKLVIETGGFVTNDSQSLGASPDAIVKGSAQSVEIKCPAPWTMIGYLLDGPGLDYKPQVQGQLLVGEFEVNHFFAYHPRMPAYYKYTVRDEAYLRIMVELLAEFCEELEAETQRAKKMGVYVYNLEPGDAIVTPGVFPWLKANKHPQ